MKKHRGFLTLIGTKISQGRLIADLLKSLKPHHISITHTGSIGAQWGGVGGRHWVIKCFVGLRSFKLAVWSSLDLSMVVRTETGKNGRNMKKALGDDWRAKEKAGDI